MKCFVRLTAMALAIAASTPALADRWTTMDEEAVSLSYGTDDAARFEIFCGDSSQVVVPESAGVKPSGDVVFSYLETGKAKSIVLAPDLCGGETHCTDRGEGEVSSYSTTIAQKAQALIWAKSPSFTVTGPTINLTMKADADVFRSFATACASRK